MNEELLRVLVIEDDPDTRENLCDILDLDGYPSETAGTFAEAFDRNDWPSFFAIIVDRKLPDGNAEEMLPRLKQLAPHAAAIVATGFADLESAVGALRAGAADYILKPIQPDLLRSTLARLSEKRRLVLERRQSEGRWRSLVEAAGSMIVILRPDRTIAYFNPFAEELTGYSQDEVLGKDYFQIFLRDVDQSRLNRVFDSILQGVPLRGNENAVLCKDGSQKWINWNATCLENHQGEKVVLAIGQDRTEKQLAEDELRRSEARMRAIVDMAADGIVTIDEHGKIETFNRAAEQIFGYHSAEILGHTADELVPEVTGLQSLLAPENFDAAKIPAEVTGRRKNGALFPMSLAVSRVYLGDHNIFTAIVRDLTETKEAQNKLLQSERLAAIGQMITGLAHESRNALQRSQACLEMLEMDLADQPELLELVGRIQRAQDHLHHLYEEVRGYAAPIRMKRQPRDISHIWRDTWAHLKAAMKVKNVRLREQIQADNLVCEVDEHSLEQVFRNILENALDVSPEDAEIEISCTAGDSSNGEVLDITVRDAGEGIPPETLNRIFEPFFTTKTRGTGLGMAIALRIIDAHGGKIQIRNAPSGGAEVQLTLPRSHL